MQVQTSASVSIVSFTYVGCNKEECINSREFCGYPMKIHINYIKIIEDIFQDNYKEHIDECFITQVLVADNSPCDTRGLAFVKAVADAVMFLSNMQL
jgi:hypothetical protein